MKLAKEEKEKEREGRREKRERKRESGKNKVFINSGQEMAKDGEKQDF